MRSKEKDTINIVIGKHMADSYYFFEDMPELTEKEQRQLFRYSTK